MKKFKFHKAPRVLSDLESFLADCDDAVSWVAREVQSWGEFSYSDLEAAILSGELDKLVDWQARYAHVVNEKLSPLWALAMSRAAGLATRGLITIDDSDPRVKDFLRTRAAEFVQGLSGESRKALATILLYGQAERLTPKEIARLVRPLIGLNSRQAQANVAYRQKVFNRLVEGGMSQASAQAQSERVAIRYASKQHRFRAETIVHTELARAYNQGAFDGVQAAVNARLMNHCEMVWSTAGTNRVCPRCMGLAGTVVGRTDDLGVTLPPLHPRCRCVIIYRQVAFDLQRFGTYEDQVRSHGGSGNIKPDRVIEGHERTPAKTAPLSVIDHKNHTGIVDKRIYYDDSGQPYFEIHTTNHGNAKNHPYGEHGEHAHDIKWADGKAQRATRELSPQERKDNGDIL